MGRSELYRRKGRNAGKEHKYVQPLTVFPFPPTAASPLIRPRRGSTRTLPTAPSIPKSSQVSSNKNQVGRHLSSLPHFLYLMLSCSYLPFNFCTDKHFDRTIAEVLNIPLTRFNCWSACHRFNAGCRQLLPGPKLSVHQVAASPAEQVDTAIWRKLQRAVGGIYFGVPVHLEVFLLGKKRVESSLQRVIIGEIIIQQSIKREWQRNNRVAKVYKFLRGELCGGVDECRVSA